MEVLAAKCSLFLHVCDQSQRSHKWPRGCTWAAQTEDLCTKAEWRVVKVDLHSNKLFGPGSSSLPLTFFCAAGQYFLLICRCENDMRFNSCIYRCAGGLWLNTWIFPSDMREDSAAKEVLCACTGTFVASTDMPGLCQVPKARHLPYFSRWRHWWCGIALRRRKFLFNNWFFTLPQHTSILVIIQMCVALPAPCNWKLKMVVLVYWHKTSLIRCKDAIFSSSSLALHCLLWVFFYTCLCLALVAE